ncbi:hypothetical protein ILYODFUR_021361 [Ilyodon furcidens]|uniref:Uncharacterized protein n=1 Tax=Ilyodon furcidens TaxID=33524 RepID=A0ABV0UTY6_9TELE
MNRISRHSPGQTLTESFKVLASDQGAPETPPFGGFPATSHWEMTPAKPRIDLGFARVNSWRGKALFVTSCFHCCTRWIVWCVKALSFDLVSLYCDTSYLF